MAKGGSGPDAGDPDQTRVGSWVGANWRGEVVAHRERQPVPAGDFNLGFRF